MVQRRLRLPSMCEDLSSIPEKVKEKKSRAGEESKQTLMLAVSSI